MLPPSNPYDFTRPVRDPAHFIGRREELQRVRTYLDHACAVPPRVTNLVILGPRGIGKTSLLNVARRLAEDRGFAVVSVPLDNALVASDHRLFAELFAGLGVPTPDLDSNHAVLSALRGIQASMAAQQRPGAALLIDECDLLASNKTLLQKIRNFFTEVDGFMLVLAGTAERFPAVAETFGPFSRFFETLVLQRFQSFEEVWDCLLEPLGTGGKEAVDRGSVEDLQSLTEGMPYEVKLLAHYMFDHGSAAGLSALQLSTRVLDRARPRLEEFRGRPFALKTPLGDVSPDDLELCRMMLELPAPYTNLLRLLFTFDRLVEGDARALDARVGAFERARLTLARWGLLDPQMPDAVVLRDVFARVYLRCLCRERGQAAADREDALSNLLGRLARGLLQGAGRRRILLSYQEADPRLARAVEASREEGGGVAVSSVAPVVLPPGKTWRLCLPGLPGAISVRSPEDAGAGEADEGWFEEVARRLERAGVPMGRRA